MPSSLLMEFQAPNQVDTLPVYTRRDPETSSIRSSRSSAPSYVSEAPTYHTQAPPTHQRLPTPGSHGVGLPPTSYAPGFHRAPSYNKNDLTHLTFNISEWSAAKNGPQARHYHNVAKRRAKLASIEEQARLTNLASTMAFPSLAALTSTDAPPTEFLAEGSVTGTFGGQPSTTFASSSSAATTAAPPSQFASASPGVPEPPLSPLEDPELVGHAAATAARERRLYMARCRGEKEALRQEHKTWDFMLGQMADWTEREHSWEGFKRNVGSRKLLGNRFLSKLMP